MSHETHAWAKEQRCGDPVTKAVLMEIANWAKPTGVCEFLSVKRIAEVVEVSERTVQRHLDRLERADLVDGGLGMLRRIERHREDGGRGANCFELVGYEMPLSLGQRPPRQSVTPPRQIVTSPRQIDGEPGDNGVTRLGDKIRTPSPTIVGDTPLAENVDGTGEQVGSAGAVEVSEPVKPHRLPADWTPPFVSELQPSARTLVGQWPRGAYEARCELFRLHFISETRSIGRKVDWASALAKWLIRDHAEVMRGAKAGVSYERLAPELATGPRTPAEPVHEISLEGGTADKLRDALRKAVSRQTYDQWFAPSALLIRGDTLEVVARTAFAGAYIEGQFEMQLLAAAQAAGCPVHYVMTVVTGRRSGAAGREEAA